MRVFAKRLPTLVVTLALTASLAPLSAQPLSDAERETFLREAKIIRMKHVSVGITGTRRATLSDGEFEHDASVQTVDIAKPFHQTTSGMEANFKDSYRYNIAAYRLDRMVDLGFVPVSVKRKVEGDSAAVVWWVDDVQMMEKERYLKKIQPPDVEAWNRQMYQARIFNELIYNTDPNLGNILITDDWRLKMIDFTRAFRIWNRLREKKNLEDLQVDRRFLAGLRALTAEAIEEKLGDILLKSEKKGLLARRDLIVAIIDEQIARRGEDKVLVDIPR